MLLYYKAFLPKPRSRSFGGFDPCRLLALVGYSWFCGELPGNLGSEIRSYLCSLGMRTGRIGIAFDIGGIGYYSS